MSRLTIAAALGAALAGCTLYPSPSGQNVYASGGSSGAGATSGGGVGGGSSGAGGSSGGTAPSISSGSSGSTGSNGASSGSGAASSGGGTSGAVGSSGGSTGVVAGTSGTSGTAAGTSGGSTGAGHRLLATGLTASGSPEVWDITNSAAATPIISSALLSAATLPDEYPAALAIASDGEILVQMQFSGLFVFRADAGFVGNIVVPWPSNYPTPDPALYGNGIAYLPQPSGPAIVVDCGSTTGLAAFTYGGPGDFDGGTVDLPAPPLWIDENPSYYGQQCFAGPSNTVLVGALSSLNLVDIGDGGWLPYKQPPGSAYGGALDPTNGDVFVVGTDYESSGGFAELYTQAGVCSVITAGACNSTTTDCAATCVPGAALPALNQATWIGNSQILATPVGGAILELDLNLGTVSPYYNDPSGTVFYGLATSP